MHEEREWDETTELEHLNRRLMERRRQLKTVTGATAGSPIPARLNADATIQATSLDLPPPPDSRTCAGCHAELTEDELEQWWRSRHGLGAWLCRSCQKGREARRFWHRASRIEERMASAGIQRIHLNATAADFGPGPRRQLATVFRARDDGHPGMLVSGPVGTGKTRFAAAAVRLWLLDDRCAEFLLARQLLRRLWSTYRDDSTENEEQVINALCTVPLLAIDDFSREGRITDAVRSALHEILSRRLDDLQPIIITTNLSLDEIGSVYDDAIRSRLGRLEQIVLDGPDRRIVV